MTYHFIVVIVNNNNNGKDVEVVVAFWDNIFSFILGAIAAYVGKDIAKKEG